MRASFARGCLRWVRQFWRDLTPEEQECLYRGYLHAFETMHEFVQISHPHQRTVRGGQADAVYLFQQLERVWRRYQE